MSTSAGVWKNNNDINIYKTIRDARLATIRSGNQFRVDSKLEYGKDCIYTEGNVANTYEDVSWWQACLIRFEEYLDFDKLHTKSLVKEGYLPRTDMSEVIYMESISGREQVLLRFLYEYMKLNPEAVFFVYDVKWYFTYEDIERIIQKNRVDNSWYSKNPALKNVDYWGRTLEINGNRRVFERKVKKVCKHGEHYIVRQGSGYDTGIRNIYCLDECANIVWQFENLFERYPDAENQGINEMEIKDDVIIAKDLSWRNEYHINIETGEAEKQIRRVNGKQEIIPYPFSERTR